MGSLYNLDRRRSISLPPLQMVQRLQTKASASMVAELFVENI